MVLKVLPDKSSLSKMAAEHAAEAIGRAICDRGQARIIAATAASQFEFLDALTKMPGIDWQKVSAPIDVAFVGIGENGHLAFNDPPADFQTEEPYLIVDLDEACRQQQVGEAWFSDISQVPRQALSMSVRQILKAKEILAVVPDSRKAQAVRACFEGEISPMAPASILRTHSNATVYLDRNSAALLSAALQTSA